MGTSLAFLAADLAGLSLSLAMGTCVSWLLHARTIDSVGLSEFCLGLLVVGALVYGHWRSGLYSSFHSAPVTSLPRLVWTIVTIFGLLTATLAIAGQVSSKVVFAIGATGLFAVITIPLCRALVGAIFSRSNWWGRRVVIVGSNQQARQVFQQLLQKPWRGLRPVGFVDDLETLDPELDPAYYLGPPEKLGMLSTELQLRTAVLCTPGSPLGEAQRLICREETGVRDWILMSQLDGFPSLWVDSVDLAGCVGVRSRNRLLSPVSRSLKRVTDVFITLTCVLLGAPLLGLIALLVRLSSSGPVLYSQERIGRHGRRFRAWKFRTMVANADQVLTELLAKDPILRAEWDEDHKLKNDPRITWIGHVLRKISLDELPQLWNVLRGDMSLVGPRPIVEMEIDKYAEDYEYYVDIRPGLTGLWQISGRNNTTYAERIAFDAYYVKNWSLWFDIYILASTIRVVLFREGAY